MRAAIALAVAGGLIVTTAMAVSAVLLVARVKVEPARGASAALSASPSETGSRPAADDGAAAVTAALGKRGYKCYLSITQPIVVHSCYADPGYLSDDQIVRIQSGQDGAIGAVELTISGYETPKSASGWFAQTLGALQPDILTAAEADAIVKSQAPGKAVRRALGWGASDLFVNSQRKYYHLKLVAKGGSYRVIPFRLTGVPVDEVKAHYAGAGFQCDAQPKLKTLRCQRRTADALFTVLAFDPCMSFEKKYTPICEGHTAYSLTASVGFADGLPESRLRPLFDHLTGAAGLVFGGLDQPAMRWILANIGGKVHMADFDDKHIELKPGTGAHGSFPNAYTIAVSGANLT